MIWLERPMAVHRCIWDDGGSDQPNRQRGQGCWIYGDIWPYGECSHKTKGAREGWPPVAVGGNGDILKGV